MGFVKGLGASQAFGLILVVVVFCFFFPGLLDFPRGGNFGAQGLTGILLKVQDLVFLKRLPLRASRRTMTRSIPSESPRSSIGPESNKPRDR